ncbi:MAG: hypothetical protein AAFR00_13670 [Pseudomonadota bacterium]
MQTQQQGEVYIRRIEELPDVPMANFKERDKADAYIISHSEKGHHHVIPGCDADVMVAERPGDAMRILYAIVKNPTAMVQTAAVAHEEAPLAPGIYELRISREYDPFADQIREVAD